MDISSQKEKLDVGAATLLTVLCMTWGFNAIAIKVTNIGLAPLFTAGIRSFIAALGLALWMKFRGMTLFPGRVGDGIVIGILFGSEFGFLYSALLYTTASSAWILLYTTPFFHTLGAHFFLSGDRLNLKKLFGLLLSFAGIVLLLSKHIGLPSMEEFMGDMLAVTAAILWAATTIYIKLRFVGNVSPHHTLFYQTTFSAPLLLLLSLMFQEQAIIEVTGLILLSLAFQGIVVAFVSYLLWFFLVHTYPVSRISSFTFLTPIFATIAGIVFLHEPLTLRLALSLVLVSIGIYAVNRE